MALARLFVFTFLFLVLALALLSSAAEGAPRRPHRGSISCRHSMKAHRYHSLKGHRRPTRKGLRRPRVKSTHSRPVFKAPLPPPPLFTGSVVDARAYGATPDGQSDSKAVLNSVTGTGDDSVSIGDGSTDVKVIGFTCGPGHGISIGSLGKPQEQSVRGVYVGHSTISNAQNGLRIKTFHNSPHIKASGIICEDQRCSF